MGRVAKGNSARFWPKVASGEPDACWPWTGGRNSSKAGYNYGSFGWADDDRTVARHRNMLAHHAAWRLTFGEPPPGQQVLHRCDNPPCCNPAHLFLGTIADNMVDRDQKERQARGEWHPKAKLTEELVRQIRTRNECCNVWALRLCLERQTIYAVLRGKTWKHV